MLCLVKGHHELAQSISPWLFVEGVLAAGMGTPSYLKLTFPSELRALLLVRRDACDSRLYWDSRLLLVSRLTASFG